MRLNLLGMFMLIILVCFIYITTVIIRRRHKRSKLSHNLLSMMLISYSVVIVYLTILPIYISPLAEEFRYFSINLIPFKNIYLSLSHLGQQYNGDVVFHLKLIAKNVVGNIMLLFPLAVFYNLRNKKIRKLHKGLVVGLFLSLLIETSQLLLSITGFGNIRVFDVDDLILNAVGFAIGCQLTYILLRKFGRWHDGNDYKNILEYKSNNEMNVL